MKRCRGSITIEATLSLGIFLLCGYVLVMITLVIDLEEKIQQSLFETGMDFHQMLNIGSGTVNEGVRYLRLKSSFDKNLSEKQVNQRFINEQIQFQVIPDEKPNWFWIRARATFELPLYGSVQACASYHVVNAGDVLNSKNRMVQLTETGKRYHLLTCMTIKNSKNLKCVNEYEAWEKGYSACKVCIGAKP